MSLSRVAFPVCLSVMSLLFLCGCAETVSPFSGKKVNADELAIELQAETRKAQAEAASKQADAQAAAGELQRQIKTNERQYAAQVRLIQSDAAAKIEQLGIDQDAATDKINASLASLQASIQAATAATAAKIDDLNARAKAAQAKIDAQNDLFNTVVGIVPSIPGVGTNPLIALGLAAVTGYVGRRTGKATGEQIGIAKGRDIGWDERDQHQSKIDSTWEEAASRKGAA